MPSYNTCICKNFYQNPFRSSILNFGSYLEFGGHLELLKDFISGYSYVVMPVEIYSVDDITQSSRFHDEMYQRNSPFCKCVMTLMVYVICKCLS